MKSLTVHDSDLVELILKEAAAANWIFKGMKPSQGEIMKIKLI